MNSDQITTLIGGLGAVVTAAGPVMNGVQGSMHQSDWTQLVVAVVMGLLGFFSNKKSTV